MRETTHDPKEFGLPDNWQAIEQPPVRPGLSGAPPAPNAMANYFQGSISPSMQHDAVFVGTEYGTPGIPTIALMPLGISGSASSNSAIQSSRTTIFPIIPPVPTPVPPPSGDVQRFQVNGNLDLLDVGMINGIPA